MKEKQLTPVEWLVEQINPYGLSVHEDLFEQAKEMEQKQRQHLLNYIEEVKDICGKLRFPYEEELNELTKKAEVILNQFKQEEQ